MRYLLALFLLMGQTVSRGALPYSLSSGPFLNCSQTTGTTQATITTNLTTAGTVDWIHWNVVAPSAPERKSGGGSLISTYTKILSYTEALSTTDVRTSTWTDGTNVGSGSDANGVWTARSGTGQGFSFTCPASTSTHTCIAYLQYYIGPGTLVVHLSDSSASDYTYTSTDNGGQRHYVNVTCQYQAASAAQTLLYTWTQGAVASEGVQIQGAAYQ